MPSSSTGWCQKTILNGHGPVLNGPLELIKTIASPIYSHVLCEWDGREGYAQSHRSRVRTTAHMHLFGHIFLSGSAFSTGHCNRY